jgi:hypothetical protein
MTVTITRKDLKSRKGRRWINRLLAAGVSLQLAK